MPKGAVTIKALFEEIPTETPDYKITKGANTSWKKGTANGVEIICDGDFAKFTGIKVDGLLIESSKYTVSGNTIVTLKVHYLETLAVGEHTIELVYSDGSVSTKLIILAKDTAENDQTPPQTGDNTNTTILFALMFISGVGIFGIMWYSKKRRALK